jgi:hypothetical protein
VSELQTYIFLCITSVGSNSNRISERVGPDGDASAIFGRYPPRIVAGTLTILSAFSILQANAGVVS